MALIVLLLFVLAILIVWVVTRAEEPQALDEEAEHDIEAQKRRENWDD